MEGTVSAGDTAAANTMGARQHARSSADTFAGGTVTQEIVALRETGGQRRARRIQKRRTDLAHADGDLWVCLDRPQRKRCSRRHAWPSISQQRGVEPSTKRHSLKFEMGSQTKIRIESQFEIGSKHNKHRSPKFETERRSQSDSIGTKSQHGSPLTPSETEAKGHAATYAISDTFSCTTRSRTEHDSGNTTRCG